MCMQICKISFPAGEQVFPTSLSILSVYTLEALNVHISLKSKYLAIFGFQTIGDVSNS